jgi:hypothetical protein
VVEGGSLAAGVEVGVVTENQGRFFGWQNPVLISGGNDDEQQESVREISGNSSVH